MRDTIRVWILTSAALAGTGGCATVKETFTNRLVCTAAKDEGFVASMWGFFGIVTSIDKRDIHTLCPSTDDRTIERKTL